MNNRRMNNDDSREVLMTLLSLWPRIKDTITDEEMASWQRSWSRTTKDKAIGIIRKIKDTCERYPTPAQVSKIVRSASSGSASGVIKNKEWSERDHWMRIMPDMANEIVKMSDNEVDLISAFYRWKKCSSVYGLVSQSTIVAYWQFQSIKTGNVKYKAWSKPAHDSYMSIIEELKKVDEKYKPSIRFILNHFFNSAKQFNEDI